MEALFKKFFWIFNLVFLALCALMIASSVNSYAKSKLEKTQEILPQTQANAGPVVRTRNFNVLNEANIFEAMREDLSGYEAECSEEKKCDKGKCVEGQCVVDEDDNIDASGCGNAEQSSLRAKLVGTAVFDDAALSVASLIDYNEGKKAIAGLYSVNDCVGEPMPKADDESDDEDEDNDGPPIDLMRRAPCNEIMEVGRIKAIMADRICLYNTEERQMEYLELGVEPEGGKVSRRPKKKKKTKKKDDDVGKGIRSKGGGQYEVDQAEVDKALGNLSSLATQARIVPAFEGGKPIGFKLFSIRPNSLYSKIGIQNGDVISRVNGYEINSPDKALEVYQKLKESKNVSVDLKRRGKPKTLEYSIVQ